MNKTNGGARGAGLKATPYYKPKLKTPAKRIILDLIEASYAGLFALREVECVGEASRLERTLMEIQDAMRP